MADPLQIARRIADERLAPLAAAVDRDQRFSEDLWREVFDFGLPGIPFPSELGGGGGSFREYCDVIEAFARRAAITTTYHAPAVLVATALADFSPALADGLVTPILTGSRRVCWAFTEPQTGSDPRQIATRVRRAGDEWVLDGEKAFITLASLADHALVFARDDRDRLNAVLVDTDQPGWQAAEPLEFMAFGGGATGSVFLDGVTAPLDRLIGDPGQGFEIMLRGEAAGKIRASATCVGIAQRALELAVQYAREREHRGEPIGTKFQTIQWLLGEIGAAVEAARALAQEAARTPHNPLDVPPHSPGARHRGAPCDRSKERLAP
ncbi:MAG: hypothetical protein AMXMBFR46_27550, partial [Acidimicrobiia bacterium]